MGDDICMDTTASGGIRQVEAEGETPGLAVGIGVGDDGDPGGGGEACC